MYNSFFGFNENPFNLTPDPRYLFMSRSHKEAIEHMLYGINERKGFIVVTGGIGTGKTTLCRTLLNHLSGETRSALIFNSFISDMELLKSVNHEFGISMPPGAETKKDYIDALNNFLIDIFAKGGNAVLMIDEAQNLSRDVLEQIRMLSNLETAREKLIQIVLIGQPELQTILAAPSLRQLNERVTVRSELASLSYEDIRGYIEHRMITAGGHGEARFAGDAIRDIYSCSKGNPRRINNICDRALLISYALEKNDITGRTVKKAVMELYGKKGLPGMWGMSRGLTLLYAVLSLIIISAAFAGWIYKGRLSAVVPAEEIKQVPKPDAAGGADMKNSETPLYTDGQKSLSILFSIYYGVSGNADHGLDGYYADLVSYNIAPEYYVVFKRPFRVSMLHHDQDAKYLVIKGADEKGATVLDSNGGERIVAREFLIENWGGEVSWIYPSPKKSVNLVKGDSVPEVLELQRMLGNKGYMVDTTGVYDQSTSEAIMKFQKDFGLDVDGIAGPRTRALLYQMVM